MNIRFALFAVFLFLLHVQSTIAQVYVGALKANINFQADQQNYVFSSEAVNFTIDISAKTIGWYAKGATFSPIQDSQAQAILEKAFGFASAPIIGFNARLPQKFKLPAVGKSVRVPVSGILTLRNTKTQAEAILEISRIATNPNALLVYFDLRQTTSSAAQGFVFTIENRLVSKRNF